MRQPLSRPEFVGLMAMLAAITAFAIDAMLPALPDIGAELSPSDPNRAQLILASFVLGMGMGTLFSGPLADALGRRPVIIGGLLLYALGAGVTLVAPTLETVLAARLLMGLGAAGPRVVVMAIVRDSHSGTEMARLMSLVMVVFMLVPAIAPSLGALIIAAAGWRAIFAAFVVFAMVALVWFGLRQPETLAPDRRRAIRLPMLREALADLARRPLIRNAVALQALVFGMLFAMLSSVQGVFDQAYGRSAEFPLWFVLIAAVSASASLLNARLVGRLGILPIVRGMLGLQIVLSALMLVAIALPLPGQTEFVIWLIWCASVFFQGGLIIGNINALAMLPVGHIAGLAASVISAVATVGSVIIAVPIGLAFDGTARPIALGVLALAAAALVMALRLRAED